MKSSFALALTLGAVSAINLDEHKYIRYIAQFGKQLSNLEEFNQRLDLFKAMDTIIEEISATEKNFTVGHNMLSDMNGDERAALLGYKQGDVNAKVVTLSETNSEGVNWVTKGGVTPVKNQGACGSCWTFSVSGAMEGAHFVASGELLSFSEQQLVDCAYGDKYQSFGCDGGYPMAAYPYYTDSQAELESDYPYTSGSGTEPQGSCMYDASKGTGVNLVDSASVESASVAQLKAAVEQQPVSIGIEADQPVFGQYTGGILDSAACGTSLDHGVLIAGWGSDNGVEYWLVKNSWGPSWGESGFIRIAIVDGAGICGIQLDPTYPITN